jgi:ABC-type branched-subunit amino acid transport system substrate-binding protein
MRPTKRVAGFFTAMVAAGTLIFTTGSPIPASAQATSTYKIGLEAPLSGDQKNLGAGMLDGAKLAAAQINARGGLLGRQVEIVPIDDAADPATGVTAAKAAIAAGLDGVVGPYNSGVGAQTLPLYLAAGITPIRLTSADSTAGLGFTLQPMTSQIAPVAADALEHWLDATKVAIVYDPTALYTQTVATALQSKLQADGVTVTAFEPIQPGEKDYSDAVTKVAATDPDVIYAATYYPEGGLIAKAVHAEKVKAKCVADYGSYDSAFVTTAGLAAARSCPVVGVPAPTDFPDAARFAAAYRKQFNKAPGTWSPYTYDSVNFLAYGVRRAGGFDATALTAALDKVNGWSGWTGYVIVEPGSGNREPATVVMTSTGANGQLHVDADWAKSEDPEYLSRVK